MEARADQHVLVGTDMNSRAMTILPVFSSTRSDPAANAHLAAGIADQDFSFHGEGAMVSVMPRVISPSLTAQTSLPVFASTATVWSSSVL